MSLDATKWAWQQKVKPTMKLILLSLADRADEKHCCYPSIFRMESDTGLNKKTIISGIKKLAEEGIISIKKMTGRSNYYQLIGVDGREGASTKNGTGTKNGTSTKNGTRTSTKNGTGLVPKTVPESTKNLSMNLPIGVDTELFGDFLSMRKELKAKNSDRALRLLITELEKIQALGQDPNAAIKRSIMNSWKSVYPEKKNPAEPQQQARRKFPS